MKNKKLIFLIIFFIIFLLLVFGLKNNAIQSIINRVNPNINMSEIETKVEYQLQKSGQDLNVTFILENQNGIEYIELPDITIDFKGREKVALDRTFKENDVISIYVKVKDKEEKELYKYIASVNPTIRVKDSDETIKNVYLDFPENENITKYYNLDKGQTWQEYIEELLIEETQIPNMIAKIEFNDGITINNAQSKIIYDRLYLYKLGNKKNNITGGFTFRILQNISATYQDNSNNMYIYSSSIYGQGYGEVELYTNKTIDVKYYNKIYFDMDYSVKLGEHNWRCHFYYGLQNGKIIDVPGNNSSSGRVIAMDISNLQGAYRAYFRVLSCSANNPVWCRVRSIYMEE